jgi:hypothetical protein
VDAGLSGHSGEIPKIIDTASNELLAEMTGAQVRDDQAGSVSPAEWVRRFEAISFHEPEALRAKIADLDALTEDPEVGTYARQINEILKTKLASRTKPLTSDPATE